MVKKKNHELHDASYRETKWIEPIIQPEYNDSAINAKKAKHPAKNKRVKMRENKQEHQHTFKHEQIIHKTMPRGKID